MSSSSDHAEVAYERNLKGLKRLALLMDVTSVCSWALGFCALTWASAVLLGAYVTDLSVWQYYDVFVLLFVEGLRFGVVAVLRAVGIYRLSPLMRWLLRSAGVFVPLWMGGFALFSLLPSHISQSFRHHFLLQRAAGATFHFATSSLPPYNSLLPSLTIFYSFILANAVVVLIGRFISGLIHLLYVQHNDYRSIHKYHDKMLLGSRSWMQAEFDLDYAFRMQSSEYEHGRTASKVCENYADLIHYLYMHKRGLEAAEVALGAEDVYVREAAANIVGFFAVLEELQLEELQQLEKVRSYNQVSSETIFSTISEKIGTCTLKTLYKSRAFKSFGSGVPLCYHNQMGVWSKLTDLVAGGYGPTSSQTTVAAYTYSFGSVVPLCYQMGVLSKLADLAAGGYGPTSTVAAYSFALLLAANKTKPEYIRMVGRVRNAEGKDLLYILLQRFLEILDVPSNTSLGMVLEKNSKGHLYALRQLLLLRRPLDQSQHQTEAQDASIATVVEAKQAVQKIKQSRKEMFGLDEEADEEIAKCERLGQDISRLLSSAQLKEAELDNYYSNIKNALKKDSNDKVWKHYCRAGIFILVNVVLPLILGFSVKASLHH